MCGIVGYIGTKKAQPLLISGLKRLEYRGYDSAGVVTLSKDNKATLLKEKGKVTELASKAQDLNDTIGIGHTRWATHGEPSKVNAHPHHSGSIYLVHNGIIENYKDIKKSLEESGRTFKSATDSEVLAALIDSYYQEKKDLKQAVLSSLQVVTGTYGIAVIANDDSQKMIVARSGSPLVVGIGDDETFVASDPSALIGHTDRIVYLNDGEIAEIHAGDIELFDIAATPLTPQVEKFEASLEAVQKNGFDHFLLKEIHEQPETLRATLRGRVIADENRIQLGGPNLSSEELRGVRHLLVVGCGTAFYAGRLAAYIAEQILDNVTFQVEIASELRYRSFNMPEGTVALIVSQSGETADTLACQKELKNRGIKTLGIINSVGSTIARAVDGGIYLHVGSEISVASTKAFTSQVSAIVMFALTVAQASNVRPSKIAEVVKELDALPAEIEKVIKETVEPIKKIAKQLAKKDHALYLGRDSLFPVALEGALKLKEISYIHAEGYAGGELKHGPIALIDDRFFEVFLLADNWLLDKSISNLIEINARGGEVLVVTNSNKDIEANHILRVNSKLDTLLPLVLNIPLQLLAYYIATARKTDVDQPRNLAKSVTVE